MAMNTADGALYFKTSDNTVITAHDNTIMHIDSTNDRVGINTTNPTYKFHVAGSGASYLAGGIQLNSTDKITIGNPNQFITAVNDTSLTLATDGSASLTILDNGNVGIGTTSPATALEVAGDITLPSNGQLKFKGTNHYPRIYAASNDLLINLDNGSGSNYTALKIDNVTGNVGIGTSSPGEKLEVAGNVEAEEFIGDLRGALLFKAQAGEALSKGDVVYISGISGNTTVVSKADADDSAKMPAFGVAAAAATLNSAVDIYTFGTLSGIDTSSYSEGDELYVSTTAGAMTNSAPTGSGSLLQKIAKVTRSDTSAGSIKIIGAGRTNAVPNLDQYKIFVGNSSNQAVQGNNALTVDIDNNAVGINTGDPDAYVSSLGARLHIATNVVLNSNTPLIYLRANGGAAMSEIRYQNSLKFTNGSAALHGFIDSSGRLTFGNATNFSDANADDFQIGNTSGAHGISIVAQNSHNASIYFADNDNNDAGRIIYNHTNNRMEFYTNRSQRMVITSAGNVGIGTNAAAEKLEVSGGHIKITNTGNTNLYINANNAGSDATIYFEEEDSVKAKIQHDASNDSMLFTDGALTDTMTLKSGRVGIGTTSPDTLLHLSNGGTTPATIRIERDDYSIEDTDVYGGIEFESQDNSAASAAGIRGKILGVAEGATGDMALAFETAGSYGSSTERLRINSVGQVGIGTNSPSIDAGVEITKAAPNTGITTLRLTNSVNNRGQRIDFVDDNAARAFTITHDNGGNNALIGTIISEPLLFVTNNTERVRILSGGNVGIGESVPTEKLHVAGNIKMQASATVLTFQNNSNTWNVGCDAGDASFKFKDGTDERIRILSDGNTIFGGTSVGAAGAMSVKVDGSYTDLYLYGAGTSQGGRIFFGDSSDRSSITGTYGTGGGGKLSFKTDTTGGTSQDRLVIDSDGSIRFNNAFTFPTSIGSSGQVLKVPSSGSTLVWADDSGGGGSTDSLSDLDGDTLIQVEESADEDVIRFDVAGTEQMVLNSTGLTVAGNLTVNGTQTVLNTSTLSVDDLNITIADGAANAAAANGAGITVDGANATLTYTSAQDEWNFNKNLVVGGKETTASFPLMVKSNTAHQGLHIEENSGAESWQMGVDGAGDLNFYNSGSTTPSITFEDSGQVGIGTSSPAAQLNVDSNAQNEIARFQGANAQLRIDNSTLNLLTLNSGGSGDSLALATSSTEAIRIDSNQNVGIGTTDPQDLLHLSADSPVLRLTNTSDSGKSSIEFWDNQSGTSQAGEVFFDDGGNLFGLQGNANGIVFKASNTFPGSELMRLKSNGFLGIGTNNPLDLIHIKSTSTDARQVIDSHTDYDAELKFAENGTVKYTVGHDAGSDSFVIGTTNVDTGRRLVIDSSGNVGINENPRFKLSVKTPAIPSGSTYAWPLDLSRPNTENRGLTFGIAASGTTNAIAGHNADVSIGHTYGTDSNGLPQYYETLRVKHIDQAVGNVGIGTTNPSNLLHIHATGNNSAALIVEDDARRLEMGRDMIQAKSADGSTVQALFIQPSGNTSFASTSGGVAIGHTGNVGGKLYVRNGNSGQSYGSNVGGILVDVNGTSNSYFSLRVGSSVGNANFSVTNAGNVGVGVASPSSRFQVEEYGVDTSSTTTTATTQVAIHTFPIADFRTARFTIQITNTTDSTYHSTEIIAVHDGTTANITEFGEVHTGTSVEATFDADISSSNFRLLATPASTDSMTFKVVCHSITV